MGTVTITINGRKVAARPGQTVLDAARAAGIDIPTLCHHPALEPIGACRVCLVEIAGQRALQPACTFPVADRLEIQTESPRVVRARKFVLELLFSERNHFCMTCPMSGACELQALGYRYGLDHWVYPTYTEPFPVDASPRHHLLDHNRCILCRRCVRACGELVANHTLDVSRRGAATMVTADMNAALKASSCVGCGTCLDVCPTGALVDKRRAFMVRPKAAERVATICTQCSLGCGMHVVRQHGQLLGIESRWGAEGSGGLLCARGRFESLSDGRERVRAPLIRRRGELVPVSWEAALAEAAERLSRTPAERLGCLASTGLTNEALARLKHIFHGFLAAGRTAIIGAAAPLFDGAPAGRIGEIPESDLIVIAAADPAAEQPVAGFLVRRALDRGARLVVVEDRPSGIRELADHRFALREAAEAAALLPEAQRPLVLYGPGLRRDAAQALNRGAVRFIPLHPGVNTACAAALGLNGVCDPSACATLWVAAGEENGPLAVIADRVRGEAFVILQAAFMSPLAARADMILPMAAWPERSGGFTATDGTRLRAHAAVAPCGQSRPDWDILGRLAERLGMAA
jgi:formate dehydrogenase major subunit